MTIDQFTAVLSELPDDQVIPARFAEIEGAIRFQQLKVRLHEQLLDAIQLSSLQGAEKSKREAILQRAISTLVSRDRKSVV